MSKMTGLSREIARTMTIMALIILFLALLGTTVFYYVVWKYDPAIFGPPDSGWLPTLPEWAWYFLVTMLALWLAIALAIRLSRRILEPLNSVATCLRLIASGDLSARAQVSDDSLGEASQLVRDFNTMAERLEHMATEQAFWNAAISHELRTPVTILRGRLQGLTDGVFEPSKALFNGLLSQIEGLSRLIEDLRVVALADNDRLQLRLESVDLATEIETQIQTMSSTLAEKGFTLTLDLQPGLVTCDPVRIRQALVALLDNALVHADPGSLLVRCHMDQKESRLMVEDSGPGIPEMLATDIFAAFQKGDSSARGSGLGLSVVQAIAKAHGGQAACQVSSLGGTCFELAWPATIMVDQTLAAV